MPDTLLQHGAVSRETVYEMARGAQAVAQADYALSISGIAGPGGGSAAKPVGTVWFGLSTPTESLEQMKIFSGDREAVRNQAVAFALEFFGGTFGLTVSNARTANRVHAKGRLRNFSDDLLHVLLRAVFNPRL